MSVSLLLALLVVTPSAPVESNTSSQAAVEEEQGEGQDEVICRRQLIESTRIGERGRSVRVCKTREEWRQRPTRR